ncbi:MAG: hypothetical protein C5B45_06575 [Chlamydiae bacterium]|nr:MAG: hypothetical protein C5B45_06575 [Chlamydiota bacterium]
MTCSVTAVSLSESYRTSENRGSGIQPEEENIEILGSENTSSLERSDHKKGLQSRAVAVLSNTTRNVAVIETIRFLAIVGMVCSAVASVLLPVLGFAVIAASACAWKNRVIQLDVKTSQDLDTTIEEVVDQALNRSPSTRSQSSESNESIGGLRGDSIITNVMSPISEEVFQEAEIVPNVKEAFLDSLGPRDNINIQQRYELLTICYFYLLRATNKMPKHLKTRSLIQEKNTKEYFKEKYNKYFEETSPKFKEAFKMEGEYAVFQPNKEQEAIKDAAPSFIMGIAQELHQQISRESYKYNNKKEGEYHTEKAKHIEKYVNQLKSFEDQQKLCFTEDANG